MRYRLRHNSQQVWQHVRLLITSDFLAFENIVVDLTNRTL